MRSRVILKLWLGKEFLVFNEHREEILWAAFFLIWKTESFLCWLAAEATGMELGTWHVRWSQDRLGLDMGSPGAEGQGKEQPGRAPCLSQGRIQTNCKVKSSHCEYSKPITTSSSVASWNHFWLWKLTFPWSRSRFRSNSFLALTDDFKERIINDIISIQHWRLQEGTLEK